MIASPIRHVIIALAALAVAAPALAQYKGDRIPGNVGLEVGSQPPPGIYAGYLLWAYPADSVKDENGDAVANAGDGLTSVLNGAVLSWVLERKIAGGNIGGTFVLPIIRNRIDRNRLDADTGADLTDSIFTPFALGWHRPKADLLASYSLYLPTGTFEAGGSDNSGLGMVGQELSFGVTAYDKARKWNGAANLAYEWHTLKKDLDLRVGQIMTLEGGAGRTWYRKVNSPLPQILTLGVAGYAQLKVTEDSGADALAIVAGHKDRVFALGPEVKAFFPRAKLTVIGRVLPEFGAQLRTQGTAISISVAYIAKSFAAP